MIGNFRFDPTGGGELARGLPTFVSPIYAREHNTSLEALDPPPPPESTKKRNRKSPRFSVANAPVASQTAVGTLLSLKQRNKNCNRWRFSVARKIAMLSGGRMLLGPRNSLRFFHPRQNSQSQTRKSRDTWCTQPPAVKPAPPPLAPSGQWL